MKTLASSRIVRLLRKTTKRLNKNKSTGANWVMSAAERKRLRNLAPMQPAQTIILGKEIETTDPVWFLHTYKEILEEEIYKFKASSDAPLILDCGANVGLSLIYFKNLYPNSRIIAFEADPQIFCFLERNMARFDYCDVTLRNQAVWVKDGEEEFFQDGTVGGSLLGFSEVVKPAGIVRVPTIRLKNLLNLPVDFLKIDIEGSEQEVLEDCREQLKNVDCIFVEYHGRAGKPQKLHRLIQILVEAGFRYHVKDAYPIKHPFLSDFRGKLYDLQLNIFGFRE